MQNVVVAQEMEDSDPPAFRCRGADHSPFFHKWTSPLLSTATQSVADGQDTSLRDERSRTSIVCVLDHVPAFGAAAAIPPNVAKHATEHRRVIAITRMRWLATMSAR
jgi:hypothetical protein